MMASTSHNKLLVTVYQPESVDYGLVWQNDFDGYNLGNFLHLRLVQSLHVLYYPRQGWFPVHTRHD